MYNNETQNNILSYLFNINRASKIAYYDYWQNVFFFLIYLVHTTLLSTVLIRFIDILLCLNVFYVPTIYIIYFLILLLILMSRLIYINELHKLKVNHNVFGNKIMTFTTFGNTFEPERYQTPRKCIRMKLETRDFRPCCFEEIMSKRWWLKKKKIVRINNRWKCAFQNGRGKKETVTATSRFPGCVHDTGYILVHSRNTKIEIFFPISRLTDHTDTYYLHAFATI